MRITRSAAFRLQQFSKRLFFVATTSAISLVAIALASGILQPAHQAHAATTPETCFAFDIPTQAITNYYDNESDNSANPACPRDVEIPATIGGVAIKAITGPDEWSGAFAYKSIASVIIPNGVTTIGNSAFSGNQLISATIPNSVTSIEDGAFSDNQLTSVAIPSGVTSIGSSAFHGNQLTTLTIPSSVKTIAQGAFAKNKLATLTLNEGIETIGGGAFNMNRLTDVTIPNSLQNITDPTVVLNSSSPSVGGLSVFGLQGGDFALQVVEEVQMRGNCSMSTDSMSWLGPNTLNDFQADSWFVRLHLANPANPREFTDYANVISVYDWTTNTHISPTYVCGGYLIDTASLSTTHTNAAGATVAPSSIITGKLTDGTLIHDYTYLSAPMFAMPADPWAPTSAELTAQSQLLQAAYNRKGQSITTTAPAVSGYSLITPSSPHAMTLAAADNTLNFVYSNPAAPTTPPAPTVTTSTTPTNPTTITINWTPSPTATSYTIQYKPQGSSTWQTITIPNPTAATYTLGSLSAGTTYDIQVIASLADGSTATSATVAATVGQELAATGEKLPVALVGAAGLIALGATLLAVRRRA